MTNDEAIEVLGGLVAAQGGAGDDALDHVKDQLRAVEGGEAYEYMVCVAGACERPEDDDLPLAAAVTRMHELAKREGNAAGADAAPVQLVAYTRDAVAQMAARAEGS